MKLFLHPSQPFFINKKMLNTHLNCIFTGCYFIIKAAMKTLPESQINENWKQNWSLAKNNKINDLKTSIELSLKPHLTKHETPDETLKTEMIAFYALFFAIQRVFNQNVNFKCFLACRSFNDIFVRKLILFMVKY